MTLVDTSGVLALLDRDDRHHSAVRRHHDEHGRTWILPWAILPEVDYLAATRLGAHVAATFLRDLRDGSFTVDANAEQDLPRASALVERYADLGLGLVDAVVMAQAERHRATAILTLDARHFRAVRLALSPAPALVPLDSLAATRARK